MRRILEPFRIGDNEYMTEHEEIKQEWPGYLITKINQQRIRWLGVVWQTGNGMRSYSVLQ